MINSTKNIKLSWTTNIRNIEKLRIKNHDIRKSISKRSNLKTTLNQHYFRQETEAFYCIYCFCEVSFLLYRHYRLCNTMLYHCHWCIHLSVELELAGSQLRIHINARIIFIASRLLETHGWSLAIREPSAKVIGNKQQDISSYNYCMHFIV